MNNYPKAFLQAPANLSLSELIKLSEKLSEKDQGELIIDGDHIQESLSEKITAFSGIIMRENPSGEAVSLSSKIPKGSVLNLFSEKDKGWFLVEYQGKIGYVSKKHSKKTSETLTE